MKIKKLQKLLIGIFALILIQMPIAAVNADTSEITIKEIASGLDYDYVYDYNDGLAKVEKAGKSGYIDRKGNLAIPLIFDYADPFSEGRSMVTLDGKTGYIDKTGEIVFSFEYVLYKPFKEGLAAVCNKQEGEPRSTTFSEWGFVDPTGKLVIPCEYDTALSFSEGLAAVRKDGKWGYIDKTGKVIIPFKYDRAADFSEGLALVSLWNRTSANLDNYGFIDKTGKVVVPLQYELANSFSEGLAGVKKDGKLGYIDTSGRVVIPFEYDSWHRPFNEGLAPVLKNGKWGYIDKTGKVVIPLIYSAAEAFSDGMAAVSIDGKKFGYIDKTGKLVIPYEYDHDRNMAFSEGLAQVSQADDQVRRLIETGDGTKWRTRVGFIDKTGRLVVPFDMYIMTPSYNEGMITMQKDDGKWLVLEISARITKDITATFGATRYVLNGEAFTQETMVYNDTAYLPAAYLARQLGLTANWDEASNITTLTSTGAAYPAGSGSSSVPTANPITRTIRATFGATQYILNGEQFDEQTLVCNDTAYLPAAYLARKLGLTVNWDAATNITTLTSKMVSNCIIKIN